MSIDHSRLVSDTYEHFRVNGKWPLVRTLQTLYGSGINVRALAAEIGRDIVVCQEGGDGECFLTLTALEAHEPAAADLHTLARALRLTADKYKEQGSKLLTHDDYSIGLRLSELETKRLGALLRTMHGISSGSGWNPDGHEFSITPTEGAFFYDTVETFGDVRRTQKRIEADSRRISELLAKEYISARRALANNTVNTRRPAADERYRLADPRLDSLFASDLAELDIVHAAGAWKASAVLAGTCLETLLLDLCQKDGRARERFSERWPRGVTAKDLLKAAEDFHLIDPEHRGMADAIRRWRNLIHPAAALEYRDPTSELAAALVSALKLIISDIATRDVPLT